MFAIADQNYFSQILKKFLGFLTIKNRLFFLNQIIESFLNFVKIWPAETIHSLLTNPKNFVFLIIDSK